MALTTVTASGDEPTSAVSPGNRRRASVILTGDASYPTNGSVVPAALFGMTKVDAVSVGLNVAGSHLYVYDAVNNKLKGFSALGTEIVNTTDVSAHRIPITVWGI